MKPFPRSVGAKGKWRWELDGGLWAAAALLTHGGVPARGGGDGWVGKHLWKVEKVAGHADLEEMGRRRRSAAS